MPPPYRRHVHIDVALLSIDVLSSHPFIYPPPTHSCSKLLFGSNEACLSDPLLSSLILFFSYLFFLFNRTRTDAVHDSRVFFFFSSFPSFRSHHHHHHHHSIPFHSKRDDYNYYYLIECASLFIPPHASSVVCANTQNREHTKFKEREERESVVGERGRRRQRQRERERERKKK